MQFKTRFFKTIAYYIIGVIAVYITYFIFGWEYKHGPGLHHIVGLLFLLGGLIRLLYYLILLLIGQKSKVYLSSLAIHLAVLISFITYFVIIITSINHHKIEANPEDIIQLNKDDKTNKIIITNGVGDTLSLKNIDSNGINKIKIGTIKRRK